MVSSLKSEFSSESDPAKRPAKISRWLRPFDIELPGRGRQGGWERDYRVAGRMAMAKYGYADDFFGHGVSTEGTILGTVGGQTRKTDQ